MAGLDLKPLSEEIIKTMGIETHELWLVKLDDETFGPFESESLKHYAAENEELFDKALATRMENEEWKPFFGQALFQRRQPQVVKGQPVQKESIFWVLDHGQKAGPFVKNDLEKKIDSGAIVFTDLISQDDGYTWHKIFQVEGFDRRFHAATALPFAPVDTQLQEARAALMEKIENATTLRPREELAEIAYQAQVGKVLNFNAEDIPNKPVSEPSISENLKWQVPTAVAVIVTLVVGVRMMVSGSPEMPEEEEAAKVASVGENPKSAVPTTHNPNDPNNPWRKPRPVTEMPNRFPASSPPGPSYQELQGMQPNYSPPNYTQMESHHEQPDNYEQEQPQPDQDENREPAAEQHSLVGDPNQPPQTLDGAMGNPQPEEASDF